MKIINLMANSVSFNLLVRLLIRAVHIISALIQLTILTLECFFDLKSMPIQKDQTFKMLRAITGLGVILSGIMLVGVMHDDGQTAESKRWRNLHLNKFLVSLLLTPFCEKIVVLLSGKFKEAEGEWPVVYLQVKFGVVVGLYVVSVLFRKYREEHNNFVDEAKMRKLLDAVERKIN